MYVAASGPSAGSTATSRSSTRSPAGRLGGVDVDSPAASTGGPVGVWVAGARTSKKLSWADRVGDVRVRETIPLPYPRDVLSARNFRESLAGIAAGARAASGYSGDASDPPPLAHRPAAAPDRRHDRRSASRPAPSPPDAGERLGDRPARRQGWSGIDPTIEPRYRPSIPGRSRGASRRGGGSWTRLGSETRSTIPSHGSTRRRTAPSQRSPVARPPGQAVAVDGGYRLGGGDAR